MQNRTIVIFASQDVYQTQIWFALENVWELRS